VVAYEPNGARLGMLSAPIGVSFGSPFNEVGSCSFNYRPDSPGYDLLQNYMEVAVEASKTGETWAEIPNGRYIRLNRKYEKIGAHNTREYSFTGYGWQLKKVLQWQTTGLNADGKRPFLSATVGTIVKTLLDEAHSRGTVPGLTYDFSTTHDSAGNPWNKVITIYYEPGANLYTILDNLAQQSMCDWRFQGRTLQLYNSDTALSTTRPVTLKPGVDVKALPIQGSIEELVDKALVIGDGGVSLPLTNTGITMPWGHWETSVSNSGVSDKTTMQLLGEALLEDGSQERIQYTAEMKMDTTTYHPFIDFFPGDYVTGPSEQGSEPYRVRQINGSRATGEKQQIDLILNDRFVEREIRNAKKTNGITGGATAGGSGGRPTPPSNDTRTPVAPQALTVDSTAYIELGSPRAQVTMGWTVVDTATDGGAIEVNGYQVEYRLNGGSAPWALLTETPSNSLSFPGLPIGTAYQFRVRARSSSGVLGQYSTVVPHTTATEDQAPPAPSKPVLSSKLGTVTIQWDGKNETGGVMPADFAFVRVWRLGTIGAEQVGTIRGGSRGQGGGLIVLSGLPVQTQTFWFTATDTSSNESEQSEQSEIMVQRISGPDLEANSVTTNELAAGSVKAEQIAAGAVQARSLAIGTVSTNLIRNGDFSDMGIYPPPNPGAFGPTIPGWIYEPRTSQASEQGFQYGLGTAYVGRGNAVLRQGNALETGGRIVSDPIPVTPGIDYKLTIFLMPLVSTVQEVGLRYLVSTDGGQTFSDMGTTNWARGNVVNAWAYVSWTRAFATGITHVRLVFQNNGDGSFSNNTNAIRLGSVFFLQSGAPALELSPSTIRMYDGSGNQTIVLDGAGASITAGQFESKPASSDIAYRVRVSADSYQTARYGVVPAVYYPGTGTDTTDPSQWGGMYAERYSVAIDSPHQPGFNAAARTQVKVGSQGLAVYTGNAFLNDNRRGLVLLWSGDWSIGWGDNSHGRINSWRNTDGTAYMDVYGVLRPMNGLFVTGNKSFVMDHPTKDDMSLVHAATEAPASGVHYWNGVGGTGDDVIGEDGTAVIILPDYFEPLTDKDKRAVLVSAVGKPYPIGVDEIEDGRFTVYGEPGRRFSWLVQAVRSGFEFDVEIEKVGAGPEHKMI